MNTILLQKILDILTEGLAHVGDFFKDLFVSDPQDGQVIGYDGDTGKWTNIDITELSFNITHTAGPAEIITITDAAANMPVKSLVCEIVPKETGTGTKSPDNPYVISGTDEVVITHNATTETITLPSIVYGGEYDIVTGKINKVMSDGMNLSSFTWEMTKNDTTAQEFRTTSATGAKGVTDTTLPNLLCEIYQTMTRNAQTSTYTANSIGITSTSRLAVVVAPSTYTDANAFRTAMSGKIVTYELATPTTITTTPTTIKTQGGSETFAANAGDIEMEYYTATAGTIKDLVSITEDITSEVTKNTTDFSDILLKVSRNNKVVSVEIYSATTAAAVNDTFLSGLPKPAMNCKVLLVNTTLGEVGTILGTLKTSGELEIATPGAKSFSGLITYVAK